MGITILDNENIKVIHSRDIKSTLTKHEIFDRIKNDPELRKMKINETKNSITLKSNFSWIWGEKIEILIDDLNSTEKNISVKSEPLLKTTIIDSGRNLKNVLMIEKIILT